MRFFSSSLPFFALLLGLTFFVSSCGDDDDDDNGVDLPTEAELTLNGGWGITSVATNLLGREAEVAGLFTEAELADEGYTVEELIPELQFISAIFSQPIDSCITNNIVTFVTGGVLGYDYSDDCTDGELFIFDEDSAPYTWALNDRQLTITSTNDVITYTITRISDRMLELSVAGDLALFTFGNFATVRDFGVTFTITMIAQ